MPLKKHIGGGVSPLWKNLQMWAAACYRVPADTRVQVMRLKTHQASGLSMPQA